MSEAPVFQLDRRSIRRAFERSSATYAGAAALQGQTRQELLARLDFFTLQPTVVLDLGAGLGESTALLRRRYPRAQVIAVDLAHAMLARGAGRRRFWRQPAALCADSRRLPLADGVADLAFSNLMLQWCDLPYSAFAEIRRVLKPGGLLLASTFGPLTLQELRAAWAAADEAPHVSQFPDLPQLAADLGAAGFQEPVLDIEQQPRHYDDLQSLLRELRLIGARNADMGRRRTLTGPQRWRRMSAAYESVRDPAGLPATWELIYMAAFAGAGRAAAGGEPEQHIAAHSIRTRTRL